MDDHTITDSERADRHMFREIRSASKNKELTLIAPYFDCFLNCRAYFLTAYSVAKCPKFSMKVSNG